MSVYIYCPRPSQGALELVVALGASRLRRFDGMDFWTKRSRVRLSPGDAIICWGAAVPEMDGIKVLNSGQKMTKLEELHALSGVVPVPNHYAMSYAREIQKYGEGRFVGRSNNHIGGHDLLSPPAQPDYLVERLNFTREYRVHIFGNKSIRAGEKVVRDGFRLVTTPQEWQPNSGLAHPWIRSYDAGWRVNYDGFQSSAKLRKIAKAATAALELTFAAVDIGEGPTGSQYVLETNRAPGIEGNSVQAYVRAITKWLAPEVEEASDSSGDEEAL